MDRPRPIVNRLRGAAARGALALSLALAAQSGHAAGVMEWLFGKKEPVTTTDQTPDSRDRQKVWPIHEFTVLRFAPIEAGAPLNQHPAQVQPEGLRQALATIKTPVKGSNEPLFTSDELAELIGPFTQAFALARPNEDIVLLSTSRAGGFIGPAMSTTARLFVQDGNLNLIVDSTRQEFVDRYRGTGVLPDLTFGSRSKPSGAKLVATLGSLKRADWVQLPMGAMPAAAPVPLAAPETPKPNIAIGVGAVAAPAAVAPAPTPAAAAQAPRSAAFYDEQEQRLTALKRLRDKGLITEEEYQQKRKEVLQGL